MKASHLPFDPGWKILDVRYTCTYPLGCYYPRFYATTPNPCGEVTDVSVDITIGPVSGVEVSLLEELPDAGLLNVYTRI